MICQTKAESRKREEYLMKTFIFLLCTVKNKFYFILKQFLQQGISLRYQVIYNSLRLYLWFTHGLHESPLKSLPIVLLANLSSFLI